MIALGVDPGQHKSGVVVFGKSSMSVVASGEFENELVLAVLRGGSILGLKADTCFIETIESMGLPVGKTTLDTMKWVGRFQEAWEFNMNKHAVLVSRGDEKITICGAATYINQKTGKRKSVTDAHIRQAIIDRFPPGGGGKTPQIGTKAKPGPLYGVSGHAWSALAVILTGLEKIGCLEED